MNKTKVMVIFGTRPDAIKMCPLVLELQKREQIDLRVCVTGQHKHMLQQVLDKFDVEPDYNLQVMLEKQTPFDITIRTLRALEPVLTDFGPDLVLVHGDTSTGFAASLAAFYLKIDVGHVEAGLRTNDIYSPYPEEFNRQAIDLISRFYFAPTQLSADALLKEHRPAERIFITGNTAIDALKYTVREDFSHPLLDWVGQSRLLIITAHRRENLGAPMRSMFRGIRRVLDRYDDVKAIYPIHMNPHVREAVSDAFDGCDKIKQIEPLDVFDFHNIMAKSYLILTDSGGIQEEAPSLGKPVLVMRNNTERPEGVYAGTLRLIGTEEKTIFHHCCQLLDNEDEYQHMSMIQNPYGDGLASKRIADAIETELGKKKNAASTET